MAARTNFIRSSVDRDVRLRASDYLAVAVSVSLPWSISATGALIVAWLVVVLSTLEWEEVRRTLLLHPAAAAPTAFCLFGALGIAWADVAWFERLRGTEPFVKLLVILLLLVQFQRSDRGMSVVTGFLISCTVLLVVSWSQWFFPILDWRRYIPGIPVKEWIQQSGEFLLCAYALGHLSIHAWQGARYRQAVLFGLVALAFLANILLVSVARSVLVISAAFVLLFGIQRFGWRVALTLLMTALLLSALAWMSSSSSSYLRARTLGAIEEIRDYRTKDARTSSGVRLEFWKNSIAILSEAPILGHGTGSTLEQFRKITTGKQGVQSVITDNPHNQTFVVAIQLGFIGVTLLYAMWIAHILLFRGADLPSLLGMGVVLHNLGAGLFNSQLFEATLGWLYIFGVGVLGGMVLRGTRLGADNLGKQV